MFQAPQPIYVPKKLITLATVDIKDWLKLDKVQSSIDVIGTEWLEPLSSTNFVQSDQRYSD